MERYILGIKVKDKGLYTKTLLNVIFPQGIP